MKICLVSLRRAVASGLILAITILPMPLALAQSGVRTIADAEGFELPESPMERAQREGNSLSLSLTEATKMALESNITIEIQNIQEENTRLGLSGVASYDPQLSAVILQVQQQYWALVLAIRQYEIQRNIDKYSG